MSSDHQRHVIDRSQCAMNALLALTIITGIHYGHFWLVESSDPCCVSYRTRLMTGFLNGIALCLIILGQLPAI